MNKRLAPVRNVPDVEARQIVRSAPGVEKAGSWNLIVHKSVKDFEMHGSYGLRGIVVSTHALEAEHGVSFGEV